MSNSSILGGSPADSQSSGRDVDALGPSDTSDSGSDVQGERAMPTGADNPGEWGALVTGTDNDSDSFGTGERASADGDAPLDGADILPDRIVDELDPDSDSERSSVEAADLPDDSADDSSDDAVDMDRSADSDDTEDAARSSANPSGHRRGTGA